MVTVPPVYAYADDVIILCKETTDPPRVQEVLQTETSGVGAHFLKKKKWRLRLDRETFRGERAIIYGGVEIAADMEQEDPFYVCDVADIVRKHVQWMQLMPRVKPFYG
ncbi:hypothetical protein ANN_08803 [Periplaneta americana]|uniref:Reverse transcriptase domain-containing protein n=1 Tax=Periplaneta americana TaxID=6978 RepID=A0ABQ8T3U6_PERAM|nr:hypothetical protein ANN_08803 [Periplaneta americana]